MRRSLTAVAAAALLAACSHGGARSLPPMPPAGNSAPSGSQSAPQTAGAFPLRQARAAALKNRAPMTAVSGNCGTVVTQHFGTLTYKVRGTRFSNKTINAAGCDVGIFIGAGDGENDNGANVGFSAVEGASFAAILVTDGVDNVHIHDGTVNGGIAGIAIDDATNVHVAREDIFTYASYGFIAEAGASYTVRQTNATGSGAGTGGAQAGFVMAGATQLANANNSSQSNQATGTTPAFLIAGGSTGAQSFGFFLCEVTDAAGVPLKRAGNNLTVANDSNGIVLHTACPSLATGGKLYVANSQNNTVSVFDGTTNALLSVISNPSFHDNQEVAVGGGRLYVANFDRNTISVLDTNNNYALLTTLSGNGMNSPGGLTVDGGRLYAANFNGNTISVFDINNNYAPLPAITDPRLNQPLGLTVNGGKLYVANGNYYASAVLIYDVARNYAPAGKITDSTLSIPSRVVFDANGDLFVTTRANGVDEFDTRNNNVLVQQLGGEPITASLGMTFGNGTLYVSNVAANSINTFAVGNNFLFHNFSDPSLNGSFGMAFEAAPVSPGGPLATPTPVPTASPTPTPGPLMYLPNGGGWIDVADSNTGRLITTITDPSIHMPAALTLSGAKLYVTNADSTSPSLNTLSIFDTTNNNALVTVLSGNSMFGGYGMAAGNGKLFVANDYNGTISVFDATNAYAPLPLLTGSNLDAVVGAAYLNGKLYVAAFAPGSPPNNNTISVYDTTNGNALVATIPGPETQDGIGAVAAGNGFFYVAGAYVNKVYVFDATTNALVRTIVDSSISNPNGMYYANGKLYVSSGNAPGGISVFDPSNNYALLTVLPARSGGNLVVAPAPPPTR